MLERRRIRVQYQALYLIQSLIHVAVPQVPLDGLQVCELIAVRRHQLNRPLKLPGPGNRRSRAIHLYFTLTLSSSTPCDGTVAVYAPSANCTSL